MLTQARAYIVQTVIARELRMMKVFLQGTDVQVCTSICDLLAKGAHDESPFTVVRPGRHHACSCAVTP